MQVNGWTVPSLVSMYPGRPVEWVASQCAYEATQHAVRDAELSGRGRMTQPTTYHDFTLLPRHVATSTGAAS